MAEDQDFLNETITQFGSPVDYKKLGLPGPQILTDREKLSDMNTITNGLPGPFILKLRTVTDYFSYNGRYEEGKLNKNGTETSLVIKGQFGEHFKRNTGGYYIRTIGYTLDENGFRQFLIDISTAKTTLKEEVLPVPISGGDIGAPGGGKVTISSTVLATLTGGNTFG
ncbi:hypothetical protein MTP99_009489 [Tenebrio molitor]|jgi:hypothetical protein|nr:hypothetical protein MTP99_009489 [Tenebrio molitor]